MKEIYIFRHGQTEENAKGIVQGSGIDSSLNQTGFEQAKSLYSFYGQEKFDLLITSNLIRTQQTVQSFIENNIPHKIDERIREICWGEHEGRCGEPELMDKYYRIINAWSSGQIDERPLGGESASELGYRLREFISDVESLNFSKALICTHGRTLRAFICLLKNWPLSRMEEVGHSNTGLYYCTHSDQGWKVEIENNVMHLNIK